MKQILIILLFAFTWMTKDFFTIGGAVDFMNTLPEADRPKAYIITIAPERASALVGYYTVIYPSSTP